jgi:hypothetical protein
MISYKVTERDGCRMVEGNVPLTALATISRGMPQDAVLDTHAARLLGVTLAMGRADDLHRLCSREDVIESARAKARRIAPELSSDAQEWFALGHQGVSSQTIFQRLTGCRIIKEESAPRDPSDLGRCRQLLEQVPELQTKLHEMALVSDVWARLVENWPGLCALMDEESPDWRSRVGSAPKTYAMMRWLGC